MGSPLAVRPTTVESPDEPVSGGPTGPLMSSRITARIRLGGAGAVVTGLIAAGGSGMGGVISRGRGVGGGGLATGGRARGLAVSSGLGSSGLGAGAKSTVVSDSFFGRFASGAPPRVRMARNSPASIASASVIPAVRRRAPGQR